VTRYDRVIPPGGKGKIELAIDSRGVRGDFRKRAIVWSNDRERMSIALYLMGVVRPHIILEPGNYLSLQGVRGHVPPGHMEIINNHQRPLRIKGIATDLPDNITWTLKEIESGHKYSLEVEDMSKRAGDYTGHLFVRTDNPKKSELVIVISGQISKE